MGGCENAGRDGGGTCAGSMGVGDELAPPLPRAVDRSHAVDVALVAPEHHAALLRLLWAGGVGRREEEGSGHDRPRRLQRPHLCTALAV
jgi:hypothetical protein